MPNDHISWKVLWQDGGKSQRGPKKKKQEPHARRRRPSGGIGAFQSMRVPESKLVSFVVRQYDWLNWIPSAPTDEIELTCILKDNQNLFKKNGPDCGREQLHQSERMSYGCITLLVHSISAKCQQVFNFFCSLFLVVFLGLLISIGLKFLLLSSAARPRVKFVEFVKILRMMGFR